MCEQVNRSVMVVVLRMKGSSKKGSAKERDSFNRGRAL